MQPEIIQELIETRLPEAMVYVEGDGRHFKAVVVSEAFNGKSRIERQQLVHETLKKELLEGSLHALSMKTYTPDEWEAFDQQQGGN